MFRRARVHPVVRRAGVFLFRRADVRQVLRPRHVIRTATMQVTIRIGRLVQRVSISPAQHFPDHPLVLRFRSVAIHHALRLRQLRRFIDPAFQWSCHSDPPVGPTFRRHIVQSAAPPPLAALVALQMRTARRSWNEWTRPCQQAHAKAGTSGQPGRLYASIRHSLCYPSPLAHAALCLAAPPSLRHLNFPLSLPYYFLTSLLLSCCKLVSLVCPP